MSPVHSTTLSHRPVVVPLHRPACLHVSFARSTTTAAHLVTRDPVQTPRLRLRSTPGHVAVLLGSTPSLDAVPTAAPPALLSVSEPGQQITDARVSLVLRCLARLSGAETPRTLHQNWVRTGGSAQKRFSYVVERIPLPVMSAQGAQLTTSQSRFIFALSCVLSARRFGDCATSINSDMHHFSKHFCASTRSPSTSAPLISGVCVRVSLAFRSWHHRSTPVNDSVSIGLR